MRKFLESYFHLKELNTNIRTEIIAGITTFMTMAYIIFVNPAMISQAGLDFGSAMMATCISAGITTILMGVFVNYPFALAAGMGENAFFTYTVCIGMKIPWQIALGCVFIEGVIFILLSLIKVRDVIFNAIPASLRYAICSGIGLLIAFVGLIDAGIVVKHPATLVGLGDILSKPCLLSLFGLILSSILLIKNVKGALLWGILLTAILGVPLGIVKYEGILSFPPSMEPTFLKMDILGAMKLGLVSVIFVFLFMDVFDTVGTLAGVAELGGFTRNGKLPRVGRAFLTDAIGTCLGAMCGTPTVTTYIESASGIASGGRTGLASIITGVLFLGSIFFFPLIKMIAGGYKLAEGVILHPVTSPALIIVGCMMLSGITRIDWRDYSESIPAFLVIITMPLTFSIATSIGFGFISFALLKLLTGKAKEASWLIYLLAGLFILRFIYLKSF